MTNACSWRPSPVTLASGAVVMSDSVEWLHQCEAMAILKLPMVTRITRFDDIGKKRGEGALKALKLRCYELEPHYVLGLPNKHQRNAYLDSVAQRFGNQAKDTLREKVLALHEKRQAVAAQDAAAA
ncbi:hypothetical protein Dolphis_84 [Pseudomonas phage Dolphis]|nr:hypothetical protein Dolphis_84 [Pseudomonas phage Dolphis]